MARQVIFADAGAFIARYRRSDAWHEAAVAGWRQVEAHSIRCVTTSYVVAEVARFLERSVDNTIAAGRLRTILQADRIEMERSTADDDLAALVLWERLADQRVGFVDCVSFAVMTRLQITTAFSFDKHFAIAGFTLWPAS